MTAVEFSPQERARLDAIEAAEPAPESWFIRKIVADELRAAADDYGIAGPYPDQLLNRADALDPTS